MTEQELRTSITPCIMAGNTWFVFEQIKAYADAQVEASVARQQPIFEAAMNAKDTKIAELRDELRVLRETSSEIVVSLFKKYSDSAIIEAENKALKDENEEAVRFSAHTLKEWKSLNAEIKRLREGIKGAVDSMEFRGVTKGFKTEWHPSFEHGILKPLLSPAPVTEDKFSVSAYPKECVPTIEQLTENDGMSMMERLEKRMPPFHGIDSPKNEDQE